MPRLVRLLKGSCALARRGTLPRRASAGCPSWWTSSSCCATSGGVTRETRNRYVHDHRGEEGMDEQTVQTVNRLKNHHLATSIQDAGWSQFLSILSVTAACAGCTVIAVPPASTSQTGSGCGVLVAKGFVRPLACVPRRWDEPAPGPQRRQEQRAPRAAASGSHG